jgi:hypothetical protein
MTIQHNTITDPDIHEPKGVASATSGKVYISNGSGSGTWAYSPCKPHAELYITSGSTTHTLAGSSAYSILNPSGEWTASGNEDILTVTPGNGTITLNQAGHYLITFWINFTTTAIAQGSDYNFKFALDGTTSTRTSSVSKPTNGADKLTLSSTGTVNATAGQLLSIHVGGDGTSSGQNITPTEAGLVALFLD